MQIGKVDQAKRIHHQLKNGGSVPVGLDTPYILYWFRRAQTSRQLLKQCFSLDQIFRIEAFGEPVVNRLQ